MRLVCTVEGEVEVDLTGKKPGRGAYLCPEEKCWEVALKKNSLGYALRTKLSDRNRQALLDLMKEK